MVRQLKSVGKRNKRVGAEFERDVADYLTRLLGIDIRRVLGQARDGGADIHLPGYYIECKRRASIAVYEWLDQCNKASEASGSVPIVVARADHQEAIVIMRLKDFGPLLKGIINEQEKEYTDTAAGI